MNREEAITSLENQIKLGLVVDEAIDEKLRQIDETDEQCRFIRNELQFTLRQKILDLYRKLRELRGA